MKIFDTVVSKNSVENYKLNLFCFDDQFKDLNRVMLNSHSSSFFDSSWIGKGIVLVYGSFHNSG